MSRCGDDRQGEVQPDVLCQHARSIDITTHEAEREAREVIETAGGRTWSVKALFKHFASQIVIAV